MLHYSDLIANIPPANYEIIIYFGKIKNKKIRAGREQSLTQLKKSKSGILNKLVNITVQVMVTECTALGDKKTKLFVNKQVITLYLMSFLCHFSFTEKGRIYWGNKIGDRFSKQQYFSSSSAV